MTRGDEIEVEVVRVCLADFANLDRFRSVLSRDELARADAYKLAEPRDVFTLARGLLRLELARRLSLSPSDLGFEIRASGKPDLRIAALRPAPDWRFSVSHTGPHIVIALTKGVDIGIDIEPARRMVNPLDIATRYFTKEELAALEALSPEARTRAFFAGWTRKEAIVKARGATMAESLTTLTVDLDPDLLHPASFDHPSVPSRAVCRLTSFEIPERGLIGAVAVQSDRVPRLTFAVLSEQRFD